MKNEHINLRGGWVHARRDYFEAKDSDAIRAKYALDIFTKVYQQEGQFKDYEADDRKEYRTQYVILLITQLNRWIEEESTIVLPKSPIGKAINYN